MTDPAAGPDVLVAVLTYRRPDDLAAVLPLLDEEVAAVRADGIDAGVLVVDNDPDAGAAEVVTRHLQLHEGSAARVVHEPEPGISAGRNRALAEARDAAVLVFVDDDERPVRGWLAALLAEQRRTGAVAVAGPVVSTFEGDLDPWLAAGGFFERRQLPTGTTITVAATNNLLLDLPRVRAAGLTFDPAFGLSGGGDTLFTRRLAQVGTMVWCAEAGVTDVVPAARTTRDWVLRRAFRSGNSATRVDRVLATGVVQQVRARVSGAGAGVARVLAGTARTGWGVVVRSPSHRARGARTVARGLGMLAGVGGHVYAEYQQGR